MLEVINLDFDYQDLPLLKNVSFYLPAGGLLHLKGANGAGKTTLLKLIAGLHYPSQGVIKFQGQSVHQDLPVFQKQICFVGHKTGINPYLTIRENCFFDLHSNESNETIEAHAAVFKLENHLDQPCGLLSAGQRRQVGLLRLWMTDAKLWLLDEPLVALDTQALEVIMGKIEMHRSHGGSVLLTSHQNLPGNTASCQEYHL